MWLLKGILIKLLVFYSDKHLEHFILPHRIDINIHGNISVTIVRVLHSNKSSVILPKEQFFFPNKDVNAQKRWQPIQYHPNKLEAEPKS